MSCFAVETQVRSDTDVEGVSSKSRLIGIISEI